MFNAWKQSSISVETTLSNRQCRRGFNENFFKNINLRNILAGKQSDMTQN